MEEKELQDVTLDSNDTQTTPLVNDHEKDEEDSKKSDKVKRKPRNWKLILEVVVLTSIYVFILGVYAAVPTVFYALKPVLQVCINNQRLYIRFLRDGIIILLSYRCITSSVNRLTYYPSEVINYAVVHYYIDMLKFTT